MSDYSPKVTVIMAIRNEEAFISRSLKAVLEQDYPANLVEVLIVDGMSDDKTRQVVEQTAAEYAESTVRIIDNPGKIKPKALNIGIAQATGEVVIIVDGHCEIAPDYVTACVKHLADDKYAVVGGPIETIGEGYIGKAIAVGMSSSFGVGGSSFRTVQDRALTVDTVPFPACKSHILAEAGPFDEVLANNQDDEYNFRIRKMGYEILLSPDIRSTYYSRSSLPKLWRQYYRYGMYKVAVMQRHPRQMRLRHFVPMGFVVSLLGGLLLGLLLLVFLWLWMALLLLYVAANLTASFLSARAEGWQYLPVLPIIFAILHFGYGFGMLRGMIRFWRGWQSLGETVAAA